MKKKAQNQSASKLNLKIEKNVPVLARNGGSEHRNELSLLLSKMEIGDSVLYPKTMNRDIDAARHFLRRSSNYSFMTRTIDARNKRIWRIEDGKLLRRVVKVTKKAA
jgi:hypothetical protein